MGELMPKFMGQEMDPILAFLEGPKRRFPILRYWLKEIHYRCYYWPMIWYVRRPIYRMREWFRR